MRSGRTQESVRCLEAKIQPSEGSGSKVALLAFAKARFRGSNAVMQYYTVCVSSVSGKHML